MPDVSGDHSPNGFARRVRGCDDLVNPDADTATLNNLHYGIETDCVGVVCRYLIIYSYVYLLNVSEVY